MAPFGSTQSEKANVEQIVAEYYAKALHIILEARIPHVVGLGAGYGNNGEGCDSLYMIGGGGSGKTSNKWFNLELESSSHVQESVDAWRRGVCQEPMVVDILLHQPTGTMEVPSSSSGNASLERQRSFNKWSGSPQRVANLRGESWNEANDGDSFTSAGGGYRGPCLRGGSCTMSGRRRFRS